MIIDGKEYTDVHLIREQAMGVLGGDITTMGTNPAGIGIDRSNDVMTSFSYSAYGMESKYEGQKSTIDLSLIHIYLLRQGTEDVFMLWQSVPSVVIGKHQRLSLIHIL